MKNNITTESAMIDYLLNTWHEGQLEPDFEPDIHAIYVKASKKIEAFRLATESGLINKLTERGYEVLAAGGLEQWQRTVKEREDATFKATLDSATAATDSARHAKQTKLIAWIALLVSIVSAIQSIFQPLPISRTEAHVSEQAKPSRVLPKNRSLVSPLRTDSLKRKK